MDMINNPVESMIDEYPKIFDAIYCQMALNTFHSGINLDFIFDNENPLECFKINEDHIRVDQFKNFYNKAVRLCPDLAKYLFQEYPIEVLRGKFLKKVMKGPKLRKKVEINWGSCTFEEKSS